MSFLEEVEIEKEKINAKNKSLEKELKEMIRNELKDYYIRGFKRCYLNSFDSWCDSNDSWCDSKGFPRLIESNDESIIKELYEELSGEIYIRIGYDDYELKRLRSELSFDKNEIPDMYRIAIESTITSYGIYIEIDPNKPKSLSANNISTDKELAKIECEKIRSEINEIRNGKSEQKVRMLLSKIKNFFKGDE